MTETPAINTSTESAVSTPRRIIEYVLLGLAGVMVLYAVIAATGNLIGMNGVAHSLGTTLTPVGWAILIFEILLPLLIAGLALWLTRSTPRARWLALWAAVAVTSVIHTEIMHLVAQGAYFNAV